MNGMKGKVAIVTGAGGGVGKAISARLASEGCNVVLVGRNRSRLQKAASEIGGKKNAMTVVTDITKEAEVLSAIEQTLSSFDKIDILVNNAGAVAYLCSNDAKWVTGTVMMVDGGVSAKQ